MARKPLGVDSQGIQKVMRPHNYLGDAAGQVGLNALTSTVGIVVYFYTDKVGVAAAAAGTILLAAKLVDAFTDLTMGWIVDHTSSRWGRARPWLLRMALPAFVAIVALFAVPSGLTEGGKLAYVAGTNIFASAIVLSATAIPFGSMLFYTTVSTDERARMGVSRTAFGYLVGMAITIGYIPITNALGGDQKGWLIFATIVGAVAMVGLVVAFLSNRERNVDGPGETQDRLPFAMGISLLFRNRYWVIMLAVMTVVAIVFGISASSGIYYVKWVLGDENLMVLLGAVGLVPVVIGFLAVAPMVRRFGATRAVRFALVAGILATVIRIIFPYDLWALLIFGSVVTLSTIPVMAIGGVLVTNTIAYGEWQHGKRIVGLTNAASGFGSKVGNGLGVAMVGWILAIGGYQGTAAAQTDSAINSILVLTIWVPGILLAVLYVLLRFYDLDAKYPQILKELDERRAAEAASSAVA